MTTYPVKFILPNNNYKHVIIVSEDFEKTLDKNLYLNRNNEYFSTTLNLPAGLYRYYFEADDQIVYDPLRAPYGGEAVLTLGSNYNEGIIFDLEKTTIKGDKSILRIGLEVSKWQKIWLNTETLYQTKIIPGTSVFYEGSHQYYEFKITIPPSEKIIIFFELEGNGERYFMGANGITSQAWKTVPIEIPCHPPLEEPQNPSGIYNIFNDKTISEFENHINYLKKLSIDSIDGMINEDSPLLDHYQIIHSKNWSNFNRAVMVLMHDIFLETEDVRTALGLFGRFIYEFKQDISKLPIVLSSEERCFWNLCRRKIAAAKMGIGFQLLCMNTPEIIFGEEIGLSKTGPCRKMYWTKQKQNLELYELYTHLFNLRKQYPVLRKGGFRLIVQEKNLWIAERFLEEEESIFIAANHSAENKIIDLTEIMDHKGPILELFSNHSIKRKKMCTIFGRSIVAFKKQPTDNTTDDIIDDYEDKG